MVGDYTVITFDDSICVKEKFFEAQKRLNLEGYCDVSVGLLASKGGYCICHS